MIFKQFYLESLGHASYFIGSEESGGAPALLLSDGALLVNDIARPDLLGGEEETRAGPWARGGCGNP